LLSKVLVLYTILMHWHKGEGWKM